MGQQTLSYPICPEYPEGSKAERIDKEREDTQMKTRKFWLVACILTLLGLAVQAVAAPRPPVGTAISSEDAVLVWGVNRGAEFLYGGPVGYNTAPYVAQPMNEDMDSNPFDAALKVSLAKSSGVAETVFGIAIENNTAPYVAQPVNEDLDSNPFDAALKVSAAKSSGVAETLFGRAIENNIAPDVARPVNEVMGSNPFGARARQP
jgi:hypothetical protein